jgi:hypothetical protein
MRKISLDTKEWTSDDLDRATPDIVYVRKLTVI